MWYYIISLEDYSGWHLRMTFGLLIFELFDLLGNCSTSWKNYFVLWRTTVFIELLFCSVKNCVLWTTVIYFQLLLLFFELLLCSLKNCLLWRTVFFEELCSLNYYYVLQTTLFFENLLFFELFFRWTTTVFIELLFCSLKNCLLWKSVVLWIIFSLNYFCFSPLNYFCCSSLNYFCCSLKNYFCCSLKNCLFWRIVFSEELSFLKSFVL